MLYLLNQYLVEQDWESADRETSKIVTELLKSAVVETTTDPELRASTHRWLAIFNARSSHSLREINFLWQKYSGGKFGFQAQADLWFNSDIHPHQLFQWGELIFSLEACPGHLPSVTRLQCDESWDEYNNDRLVTVEFTFFGRSRDNRSIHHEQSIWFGELLLRRFEPRSKAIPKNKPTA